MAGVLYLAMTSPSVPPSRTDEGMTPNEVRLRDYKEALRGYSYDVEWLDHILGGVIYDIQRGNASAESIEPFLQARLDAAKAKQPPDGSEVASALNGNFRTMRDIGKLAEGMHYAEEAWKEAQPFLNSPGFLIQGIRFSLAGGHWDLAQALMQGDSVPADKREEYLSHMRWCHEHYGELAKYLAPEAAHAEKNAAPATSVPMQRKNSLQTWKSYQEVFERYCRSGASLGTPVKDAEVTLGELREHTRIAQERVNSR